MVIKRLLFIWVCRRIAEKKALLEGIVTTSSIGRGEKEKINEHELRKRKAKGVNPLSSKAPDEVEFRFCYDKLWFITRFCH